MLRLTTAILAAVLSFPAVAGEGADITLRHLYAGTTEAGVAEVTGRSDAESRFGKGLMQFMEAISRFGRALYRHGYDLSDRARGPMLIRVPINPDPEPLDYGKLRAILEALVADLDVAQKTLREAGVAGDYVIPVDVMKVAVDIDEDGHAGKGESIGAIIGPALGINRIPRAPGLDQPGEEDAPTLTLGLDRADAIWLAGYSNVTAAFAEFLLAHDFRMLADTLLPHLFPRAGLGLTEPQRIWNPEPYSYINQDDLTRIFDLVATIHTMDWPVIDRDRLRSVQERFRSITALSRQNWQAIMAETDNDRELLPSPRQNSVLGGPGVTDEQVGAWLGALDVVDDVLDGELLIPHWRFQRGIDVNAYVETATRTDPVLLISGHDAVQFLRDGPVMDDQTFADFNRNFGWQWLGYAFWFN
jgi:hypothetical protein